jgi:peptide/nickel transport system substrate-binding protein
VDLAALNRLTVLGDLVSYSHPRRRPPHLSPGIPNLSDMRLRLVALVLSLSLPGCAGEAGRSADGDTGGTMVIIAASTGSPMIPPLVNDLTAKEVTDAIYEPLAEIGPALNTVGDGGFEPRLAQRWQWSPDSLSIAFSLDPRARWHDGRPVRASDVRFSVELAKDPKAASEIAQQVANIDSVSVRDSLTAVVWFKARTPEQFYDLAYQVRIMPEHVFKDIPRESIRTSEVARNPVGSGRFRFVRWDPGVRIEVIADTAHYRARPKLDRIIWSLAPDGNAALTQLFSGQGDYFETLSPDVLPRVDSSTQLKVVPYAGLQYAFLGFNQRDPKRLSAPHPILGDARVRRAISMGLDREAMLRNVFDTLGVLGLGPYPRPFADTSVGAPRFDRAAANALLDSAGWRLGADSVRSKGGRPLAFSIMVPNSSRARMRYAVLLQEQLKQIGVRANIDALEFRPFLDRQSSGNFDAATMLVGVDPSPAIVRQSWASTGTQNFVKYSNPTFDALTDSAQKAFDASASRALYRRAYRTLIDDAPAVWLYDPLFLAGAHKRIRPAGMRADAWWAGLPEFWIPANERIERDRIGLRPAQP